MYYMFAAVSFAWFSSSNLCTRKGPKFWIPMVLLAVAAYCILIPIAASILIIFVLQTLPGMSTGILFTYATSEAMQSIPMQKKSAAMGFYQAFYAIGMTLFPMITGTITSKSTIQGGYFFLAAIALAGCLLVSFYYYHQNNVDKSASSKFY